MVTFQQIEAELRQQIDFPPSDWEIRAVVREFLSSQAALVAWFAARVPTGLVVLEHYPARTPTRLEVTVDVADVIPEDRSCPLFRVQFDLHVFETSGNTQEANQALHLLEEALIGQQMLEADAQQEEDGIIVLRNVQFVRRLGQAPEGDGWTVATAFSARTHYHLV